MKFSEVVLVTTFLRSSMRQWKHAKEDRQTEWPIRCDHCSVPTFGTNHQCWPCYQMSVDGCTCADCWEDQEKLICDTCEYEKDGCRCEGGVFIPCRYCGDNCVDGDMPEWRFCSGGCMRRYNREVDSWY